MKCEVVSKRTGEIYQLKKAVAWTCSCEAYKKCWHVVVVEAIEESGIDLELHEYGTGEPLTVPDWLIEAAKTKNKENGK